MLIENKNYKRNSKGNITKRQVVAIQCDSCGEKWETLYEYRKRKKYKDDLCKACRQKRIGKNRRKNRKSSKAICLECKREFVRFACSSKEYCSRECLSKSSLKSYEHLYGTFEEHLNEWAYICGLIIGDGHMKIAQRHTAKITIAFDIKYEDLIDAAILSCEKLGMSFSFAPQIHANCKMMNFSLPNGLLEKYGMLWHGNKYDAKPSPCKEIVQNISFAIGLINSDGYWYNCNQLRFVNTVESIVESFVKSMEYNGIECKVYRYASKVDVRTGNSPKDSFQVVVGKQGVEKILNIESHNLKGRKER